MGSDDLLALKIAECPQIRNGLDDVKQKIPISLSCFTLLNKHQKPTDHKTENLLNDRNYGPKINKRGRIKSYKCRITTVYMHLEDSLERVYHLQMIGND